MSGSAPTNDQAVDFEKQQAAQQAQQEADRQARLTQGKTLIDQIFSGTPVMKTTTNPYDWSTFQAPTSAFAQYAAASNQPVGTYASGVPTGYTAVQVQKPAAAATTTGPATSVRPGAATGGAKDPYAYLKKGGEVTGSGRGYEGGGAATGATPVTNAAGQKVWALKDASGKTYYQGDPFDVTTSTDTGQRTGGFDDAFYNKYKQTYLDYYLPDEARQYGTAKRDLLYSLGSAGLLDSSAAAQKQGDLAYNDSLAQASIQSNATKATGDLQSQIEKEKETAINQLYSTEDPTLAASLAQSSADASKLVTPTLTPAASLFAPALTAAGSAASTYLSPYSPYLSGQTSSATPASANATSEKIVR